MLSDVITRLSLLFGGGHLARGLLVTVLPLRAQEMLGSAQLVSALYFVASLSAVMTTLVLLPRLSRRLSRPAIFLGGLACIALCLPLLASDSVGGLLAGLAMLAAGAVVLDVTTSLYVQDSLRRDQFLYFEPVRLFVLGVVSVAGPWSGVWLAGTAGDAAPFAASLAVILLLGFYFLAVRPRLAVNPQAAVRLSGGPLRHIGEYWRQPRMRLAYILAAGRSGWWAIFMLYMPIFATDLGLSALDAAGLVSLSMVWVLAAPFWGMVARRFGSRPVLVTGFCLCGLLTIGAGALHGHPRVAIGFFVAASGALSMLDGPGNVFFLRAVRPLRRMEMTAIFTTYREFGQVLPQFFLMIVLLAADIPVALVLVGAATIGLGLASRKLPRRI